MAATADFTQLLLCYKPGRSATGPAASGREDRISTAATQYREPLNRVSYDTLRVGGSRASEGWAGEALLAGARPDG